MRYVCSRLKISNTKDMKLYSFDEAYVNESENRKKELLEIDSFNAMIAYLGAGISIEEFSELWETLLNLKLVSETVLKKKLLNSVLYEARQLGMGNDPDAMIQRIATFRDFLTKQVE